MDATIEHTRDREHLRSGRVEQLSGTLTGSRHRARLLAGLPVAERRLQLAGVSTAVLEGGAGPPIVLLHVLIWGRHDRANRLRIAEIASHRYGWPLHVIENCADDPPCDQPRAFLDALRVALGTERSSRVIANRRQL